MKFSRILIAVDNSPYSAEAAQSGFQLAQQFRQFKQFLQHRKNSLL
jgi:hypothetical protein